MSARGTLSTYSLENFRQQEGELIDVRSPIEYKKGHWPGAINIPLFSDKEREKVGTIYKRQGREAALLIGLRFTNEKLQDLISTLNSLTSSTEGQSKPKIIKFYCWRGGMRSNSLAWLSKTIGIDSIVLKDGYKAYRKWVLNQFETCWPIRILGGKTGTGKTELLMSLKDEGLAIIDLEGLANHRGSSFGGLGRPEQPTNQNFENLIAENLDQVKHFSNKGIWIEDESSNLGKCSVPKCLFDQMKKAPLFEIMTSKEERVKRLVKIYSTNSQAELIEATLRIRKRIGEERTKRALDAIQKENWSDACTEIINYYDKCYEYSLKNNPARREVNITGLNTNQAMTKILNEL